MCYQFTHEFVCRVWSFSSVPLIAVKENMITALFVAHLFDTWRPVKNILL